MERLTRAPYPRTLRYTVLLVWAVGDRRVIGLAPQVEAHAMGAPAQVPWVTAGSGDPRGAHPS